MAETRRSVLRAIFKPWYVKVGSGIASLFALIGGYSGVQSQFPDSLPLLQQMIVMTNLLVLPWWGWLLVLQSIFVYALFEYVRVSLPRGVEVIPANIISRQGPAELKYGPSTRVIWDPWKHMPAFTITQFAKIIAKDDPALDRITTNASAYRQLVFSAVQDNSLPYIREYFSSNGRQIAKRLDVLETKISRDKAIAWAKAKSFDVSHIE